MPKTILKKVFSIFVVFTTIFWTLGPITNTARAATIVQFYGCGVNEPCYWVPPQGMVVPALSDPLPLFSFRLQGNGSATLNSININLIDTGGNATTSEIASLSIIKEHPGIQAV